MLTRQTFSPYQKYSPVRLNKKNTLNCKSEETRVYGLMDLHLNEWSKTDMISPYIVHVHLLPRSSRIQWVESARPQVGIFSISVCFLLLLLFSSYFFFFVVLRQRQAKNVKIKQIMYVEDTTPSVSSSARPSARTSVSQSTSHTYVYFVYANEHRG